MTTFETYITQLDVSEVEEQSKRHGYMKYYRLLSDDYTTFVGITTHKEVKQFTDDVVNEIDCVILDKVEDVDGSPVYLSAVQELEALAIIRNKDEFKN